MRINEFAKSFIGVINAGLPETQNKLTSNAQLQLHTLLLVLGSNLGGVVTEENINTLQKNMLLQIQVVPIDGIKEEHINAVFYKLAPQIRAKG